MEISAPVEQPREGERRMSYTPKSNSGTLFRNYDKKSGKSPDLSGTAVIDGVEYRIAAWSRLSKDETKKFLSLAFTPKDAEQAQRPNSPPQAEDIDF